MRWLILLVVLASFAARADEGLWQLVAGGGQVLFVRHAATSGEVLVLTPSGEGFRVAGRLAVP